MGRMKRVRRTGALRARQRTRIRRVRWITFRDIH
jgi:hypothetical protein